MNIQVQHITFLKKNAISVIVLMFFSFASTAQTIIWSETFPDADGITNDPSGDWTSTCASCTFSNGNDYFQVVNNEFRGEDMDGQGVWLSEIVDISAFNNVSVSLILRDLNSPDADDSISASYSIDGGTTFIRMSRGAYYDDFNGYMSAVAQNINAATIQVRVLMYTNGNNDEYSFDDIYIVEPATNLPGSGLTLDLDDAGGTNTADVVELDDSFPLLTAGDFTVAAWVNSDNVGAAGQRVFNNDELDGAQGYSLSLGDPGSGRFRFYIRGVSPVSLDVTNAAYAIGSNEWNHVAMTHNATTNTRSIFVNGVLAAIGTYTGNPNGTPSGRAAIGGEAIQSSEVGNHFNGEIDEVSIWDTDLSQTEIRNIMCSKLVGNETNLMAYYRFDDGAGHVVRDETGNYPAGLVNMDINSDWVISGASIGDISAYAYNVGSWGGTSVFLQSPESDSLEVSAVTGNPECVHIYHVNQFPNTTNGSSGVGSNDQYFGVFHALGSSTTYQATHYYRENDAFQAGADEMGMLVYSRSNNAGASWSSAGATLDQNAKTLTMTALSTEFILGNSAVVLPIDLISFKATAITEELVEINWTTATEINTEYFSLQRSFDGTQWTEITRVQAAGNSTSEKSYKVQDQVFSAKIVYYKIIEVDRNGISTELSIDWVRFDEQKNEIRIYPNPATDYIFIQSNRKDEARVEIYHLDGRIIKSKQLTGSDRINVSELTSGIYNLVLYTQEQQESFKLIVNKR